LNGVFVYPIFPALHGALAWVAFRGFIVRRGDAVYHILNDLSGVVLVGRENVWQFNVETMAAFAKKSAQHAGSFLAVVPLHDALSAVPVHKLLFAQRADWMFPALTEKYG
jgi:hypothetical protein